MSVTSTNPYVSFEDYLSDLSERDRATLSTCRILFVYPIRSANRFEPAELPISLRILMATTRAAGCIVDSEDVAIDETGAQPVEHRGEYTVIVIHPMISTLSSLGRLLDEYRLIYPTAKIVLQNSDHHQHEKLIGGPKANLIAENLIASMPQVDAILVGFAEHALLSLLIDRPTRAVIGRQGAGPEEVIHFLFGSLPRADAPTPRSNGGGAIRVQRARGCLAPCTYCTEGQANAATETELPWDGLAMDAFVDELAGFQDSGYFFVNIADSSFEDPGRRGREELLNFCRQIIRRGIRLSFKIHLRAESVVRLSDDDLATMKDAGVDVIICGLESGSQVELEFFGKIATAAQSKLAFNKLENPGTFCNILGYMMFSPITTTEILIEKVEFLRSIGRGWDFLNLTNRVLVFYGTKMHRQLVELGLARADDIELGYVDYRYRDSTVREVDGYFNRQKRERPELLEMNNLLYDALNLRSRLLNPANSRYLASLGASFGEFCAGLDQRMGRLNTMYCDSFLDVVADREKGFLPRLELNAEIDALKCEIKNLMSSLSRHHSSVDTLYLQTWMSAVNSIGARAS